MDERVKGKLQELVGCGVRRVPEMRRHLGHFVTSNLFSGRPAPGLEDARYWPSNRTVLNAMHQAISAQQYVFLQVHLSQVT